MPKKATTIRLTHVESSQPKLTVSTGPTYQQFQIKQRDPINEPRCTIAQIKNALLAVHDKKSGCDFLLKYGTPASITREISIGVDQLMGLAKTVALAEKLLHLMDDSFNNADDYLVKCERQGPFRVTTDTAIADWLKSKNVSHNGYLFLTDPSYWELIEVSRLSQAKVKKLSLLEKESIDAAKQMKKRAYALNWRKLGLDEPCPQVVNGNQLKQAAIEQEAVEVALLADGESYLTYEDRYTQFAPLFELYRLVMKNGEIRTDFCIAGTVGGETALRIVLAHVIERMSASLVQKIELDNNGRFFQTYETTDWWSSISLHFRGRLLGSIMRPCLNCGKELTDVQKRTKTYCDDTCSKSYRRKKATQVNRARIDKLN